MARKGLANQIWTTDIDNVLRGLRRQGRLLQLITVCKKAKKLRIKGRGWGGRCAVSQKEREISTKGWRRKDQTSDALEENNTVVDNVIETWNVGPQSVRLSVPLDVDPKYCIACLCKPDSCACTKFRIFYCLDQTFFVMKMFIESLLGWRVQTYWNTFAACADKILWSSSQYNCGTKLTYAHRQETEFRLSRKSCGARSEGRSLVL